MMDSIISAGGFAKRMGKQGEKQAKALFELNGKPALSYVINQLDSFYEGTGIKETCYLTINKKFEKKFKEFKEDFDKRKKEYNLELIVEDSTSEENKLGFAGGLLNVFKNYDISTEEGVLILAGDGVSSLDLNNLSKCYMDNPESPCIALYDMFNRDKVKDYGVAILDDDNYIIDFEEKPDNPASTFANITNYILRKEDTERIEDIILKHGKNAEIMGPISKDTKIKAHVFEGYWFDIGTPERYEEAKEFFEMREAIKSGN